MPCPVGQRARSRFRERARKRADPPSEFSVSETFRETDHVVFEAIALGACSLSQPALGQATKLVA